MLPYAFRSNKKRRRRSKRFSVGVVIMDTDDKVLLVKNRRGWNPPGGGIEAEETWFQAAAREFFEETLSPLPFESTDYTLHHMPNSILYVCRKKLPLKMKINIIKNYDANKVLYHETSDILFSNNFFNLRKNMRGQRHGRIGKLANFVPDTMAFVQRVLFQRRYMKQRSNAPFVAHTEARVAQGAASIIPAQLPSRRVNFF